MPRQNDKERRGVDEGGFEILGGVGQWVQVRGDDRENPVLLVLHAHSASSILCESSRAWERDFTVVQWDRRTAGRTLAHNGKAGSEEWSFDLLVEDGLELVELLCRRLGCDKLVLLAHSQGSIIGSRMIGRCPQRFAAYVGLGQTVDMPRNDVDTYDVVLDLARRSGNDYAVRGLVKLGRPPYATFSAWTWRLLWSFAVDAEAVAWQKLLAAAMSATGQSIADVSFLPARLFRETMAITPSQLGTRFEVPLVFIQGERDVFACPQLVKEYFELVEAPSKVYVPLPDAGHFAFFMQPELIREQLVTHVLARRLESAQKDHHG